MKKHSLIEKELLTDGIIGLVFLAIGIVGLIKPATLFSVVFAFAIVVVQIIAVIISFSKKFDTWDEMAKTHYATVDKIVNRVSILALLICIVVLNYFNISIEINACHLMIIYGSILLLQATLFIILEKRDL